MKKSVEILGLPVISITEGRELGMSKPLLIDAKNGTVAAVTIEDEDVALAANLRESGNGWQYWTILLLIIAFATYSVVRSVARAKKIKALEAEKDVAYNN